MKSGDPFAQLQRYMQAQKKKDRPVKAQPMQPTATPTLIIPSAPTRDFHNQAVEKPKQPTPIFMENRSIRAKPKEKIDETPVQNQPRYAVRPSPLRLQQNNTKGRVIPAEVQPEVNQQPPIIKHRNERSVSQKSYDFVADRTDYDDDRLKKLCVRRQKLVEDYEVSNDYWNRDTPVVVNEISKSFSKPEVIQFEKNLKEIWEDPKLTKMKERMNYHKEQLKNKESNAVLKGRSQTDVEKNIEPVDPFYLKNNTPDKKVRLSNLEGQRIKAIFNGNANENEEALEKEWARGKSPGLKSPAFKPPVNNIIPSADSNAEEKKPKVRPISPLKYKYDFCSQIPVSNHLSNKTQVQSGQEFRAPFNPEPVPLPRNQPKSLRENIESSPAFNRRQDASPNPRNMEKRELILTPSRKNLMNDYWAKMNSQGQTH